MIPTPADRALAATFVAIFDDGSQPSCVAVDGVRDNEHSLERASADEQWELAFLLIAVARRAGWTPPAPIPSLGI